MIKEPDYSRPDNKKEPPQDPLQPESESLLLPDPVPVSVPDPDPDSEDVDWFCGCGFFPEKGYFLFSGSWTEEGWLCCRGAYTETKLCCGEINDKGCFCWGSYIGVWLFGILYVFGFLYSILDLAACKGVYYC